jgi:phosphate transport system substrate-binding protein
MSKKISGRCLNIGNCGIANSTEPVQLLESDDFVCPECGKSLVPNQVSSPPINPLLLGLLGLGVIGAAAVIFGLANVLKPKPLLSSENFILRLAGSNTLGAKLAPALVEAYFRNKGCANITQKTIKVELIHVTCNLEGKQYLASISFKGSGTAFTGLKDGSTDIGMASRKAKPAEVVSLAGQGDLTSPANEHVVALDGVAIIVNPSNQIPRLNVAQVRSIFAGKIDSFNLVGGPNKEVQTYRRDDKSGTFDSFKSLVMDGDSIDSGQDTHCHVGGDPEPNLLLELERGSHGDLVPVEEHPLRRMSRAGVLIECHVYWRRICQILFNHSYGQLLR